MLPKKMKNPVTKFVLCNFPDKSLDSSCIPGEEVAPKDSEQNMCLPQSSLVDDDTYKMVQIYNPHFSCNIGIQVPQAFLEISVLSG